MSPTARPARPAPSTSLLQRLWRLPFGVRLAAVIALGMAIGFAVSLPSDPVMQHNSAVQSTTARTNGAPPRADPSPAPAGLPAWGAVQMATPPAGALNGLADPPAEIAGDMVRSGTAVTERTEDGELQGVHIFPGRNRGAFARMGLHPGDLVTAVNGAAVGGDGMDLQGMLQNGGTITVYRAGQLQTFAVQPAAAEPAPPDTAPPDSQDNGTP